MEPRKTHFPNRGWINAPVADQRIGQRIGPMRRSAVRGRGSVFGGVVGLFRARRIRAVTRGQTDFEKKLENRKKKSKKNVDKITTKAKNAVENIGNGIPASAAARHSKSKIPAAARNPKSVQGPGFHP